MNIRAKSNAFQNTPGRSRSATEGDRLHSGLSTTRLISDSN
ncbi:hypothetical protein [Gloeocapsa sp. PCC 73106]|nr:hypothetical protein [Gloeocapsa sp. PCC 73106]